MNMNLALLLLAITLSSCVTLHRTTALDIADPGRLPSAHLATNVPGLRPCNNSAQHTLHIDQRQPVNILVYGNNGSSVNFLGLAKALASHGQQTVCFEYDGRDSLKLVSGQLVNAVYMLAQHLVVRSINKVTK